LNLILTKMYINSFCSISPMGVLVPDTVLSSLQKVNGTIAYCQEPDYKDIIPPMQLRRMTKPVRTGVAAAKICMQNIPNSMPTSIHVGTAYGMLQDSENFLQKMIVQEEQMLNPTAFIQSTHNTVAGQIALSMGCLAHNMTFVHKAHSFESALLDAELMKNKEGQILTGAVDELTETSYTILKRFDVYHDQNTAGEGATFLLLSDKKSEHSIAQLTAFDMFVADSAELAKEKIKLFCDRNELKIAEEDFVLTGMQDGFIPEVFKANKNIEFKQYCGEYPTATAFAIALASLHIKEGKANRCWILNGSGKYYSIYCIDKVYQS
jgi:3-oxoacyl-[acyl-carrier-protein] synthase II